MSCKLPFSTRLAMALGGMRSEILDLVHPGDCGYQRVWRRASMAWRFEEGYQISGQPQFGLGHVFVRLRAAWAWLADTVKFLAGRW